MLANGCGTTVELVDADRVGRTPFLRVSANQTSHNMYSVKWCFGGGEIVQRGEPTRFSAHRLQANLSSNQTQTMNSPGSDSIRKLLLYIAAITLPATLLVLAFVFHPTGQNLLQTMRDSTRPPRSVSERLADFGDRCRLRWRTRCDAVGVVYPPPSVTFVALKAERQLDVYAAAPDGSQSLLVRFPILAASGGPGPKLLEGDLQVPEGVYGFESLHPSSRFHIALRVGYPSAFDREMARIDGRDLSGKSLGNDIMIHGGSVSVGCLAMGDLVAEELFTIAADCGLNQARLLVVPWDLETRDAPTGDALPAWASELYSVLRAELQSLRAPAG
jgi:hypothetical protein